MDEKKDVSYLAFESSQARMERINTRLWIAVLVLIFSLIGTNIGWIIYESQWQYVQSETTVEATQEGENNVVSGGDINYGAESKDN